jgi:hypothetical protein
VIVDQPRMPVPAANTAGKRQSMARPVIRAAGEPSAPRVHGLPSVRNALTGQPRSRPHPYGPACPGNYWCQQCGPGQPAPRTAPAVIRQGNDQSADQQWGICRPFAYRTACIASRPSKAAHRLSGILDDHVRLRGVTLRRLPGVMSRGIRLAGGAPCSDLWRYHFAQAVFSVFAR